MNFPAGEPASLSPVSGGKPYGGFGSGGAMAGERYEYARRELMAADAEDMPYMGRMLRNKDRLRAESAPGAYYSRVRGPANESLHWQQQWWQTLFATLPPPAKARPEFKPTWPEAARK